MSTDDTQSKSRLPYNFDGYAEAQSIDTQVSALLSKYPMLTYNMRDWLAFLRTVQTTLIIVEHAMNEAYKLNKLQ